MEEPTIINDGFGGSGIWLFAILALMWGGFGGNRYGADGRCATVEDLNNSSNFTRLESQVQANGDLTERKIDGIANGISSLGYEVAQQFGNTNMQLANGIASVNAVTTAQTQKILDAMAQNKIDALQAQVSELKTQNMFCGIPRINPYGYGVYPYNQIGCGCNNNI